MKKERKNKLLFTSHIHKRDEEGRVIVNMNVKDDNDFLSVFSSSETPVINSNVAEFIENSTFSVLPQEKITLRIFSDCIDEKEKEDYQKAIKEYYSERYILNNQELKRNVLISIILAIGGILTLALAYLIDYKTGNSFWMEVVNIIAWVFTWEAVHITAFTNRSLRIQKLRDLSYSSMKVEFYSAEEIKKDL